MGFPNYCVVENDTARYYDELGRQDAAYDAVSEIMEDLKDTAMFRGQSEYGEFMLHLGQFIEDLITEDGVGDDTNKICQFAANLITGIGKERDTDSPRMDFEEFLKGKIDTYLESKREELTGLYEKQLEADREDAELARHGL